MKTAHLHAYLTSCCTTQSGVVRGRRLQAVDACCAQAYGGLSEAKVAALLGRLGGRLVEQVKEHDDIQRGMHALRLRWTPI